MSRKRVMTVIAAVAFALAVALVVVLIVANGMNDRRREAQDAQQRMWLDRAHQQQHAADRAAEQAALLTTFAEPTQPAPEDAAELVTVFDTLSERLTRGDAIGVQLAFDLNRAVIEMSRGGAFDRAPGGDTPGLRSTLREGVADCVSAELADNQLARWDRTEVQYVRWSGDRTAVVVFAVHRSDAGEEPLRFCWWLTRQFDGWKLYDFENMRTGVRCTRVVAALLSPELAGRDPMAPSVPDCLQQAMTFAAVGDAFGADEALAPLRGVTWPDPFQALLERTEGTILVKRGDAAAALARFDASDRLAPNAPLTALARGHAHLALNRPDDALATVAVYRKEAGPDAPSSTLEGRALALQKKPAAAATAFRAALEDEPASVDALDGLRRALPNAQKGELGERLARLNEPGRTYAALMMNVRRDDDTAAADALIDAIRKARPDDTLGLSDDIRRKVRTEKFADAVALLKKGLALANPDDREMVLEAYLFAMRSADKPLDAYKAVPAAHARSAFRTLAEDLDPEGDEDPDAETAAKRVKQLTELVTAHRAREPNDAWAWFFEASALRHTKEYAKAEKVLAAGFAKLPKAAEGDQQAEFVADRFRAARVECLFKLKKAMTAYRDIGPVSATFRQLAHLHDAADDLTGLAGLLAEHRKREPNDDEWLYWQAHLHFRKDNFTAAIPMFKSYLRTADENAPYKWLARDDLIRALVRTRPIDAQKALKDYGPETVSHALQAAVAAAVGDRTELERLLAGSARSGKTWFYSDTDFRRFIEQDKYRDLRTKYPNPNPPKKTEG